MIGDDTEIEAIDPKSIDPEARESPGKIGPPLVSVLIATVDGRSNGGRHAIE